MFSSKEMSLRPAPGLLRRVLCGALLLVFSNSALTRADSWQSRAPVPGARAAHSAVWTGREMLVWGGGIDGQFLDSGARYNPVTDAWRVTSPSNAPSPRWFHAAVWTGSEMIVWGGRANFAGVNNYNDGARYNPSTDRWTPIRTQGAPSPHSQCAAVWTGSEMIVWGGATEGGIELNDGARYIPETDTWAPISNASGLEPRMEPTGIWTGGELIVFGGMKFTGGQLSFGNGARYHPTTDSWVPLPGVNSPGSRTAHTAVWTGERMMVWGGYTVPAQVALNTGASYDPGADSWTPLPVSGALSARMYHATVWTGTEMIVWGGQEINGTMLNTGARYKPASQSWAATAQAGAPGKRQFWRPDLGIWTGSGMLICAGSDYPASLDSTFLYRLTETNAPPPPPPPATSFDLSRDFSPTVNPGDIWSYGWLEELAGPFTPLSFAKSFYSDNGQPISAWQVTDDLAPGVYRHMGDGLAVSAGGAFTAPPGTMWFWPGNDGTPRNFGVIRFRVPAGRAGNYRIETSVDSLFDGPVSKDSEFHVTRNGEELFGRFIAPNSGTGYSNTMSLAGGDTIDFAVGRGEDGSVERSGLKIAATLTLVTNLPPPPPPPPVAYDVARDYSMVDNPTGPWSYGWKETLSGGFARITYPKHFYSDNGVPLFTWQLTANDLPSVSYVVGPGTAVSAGGQFVAEPGILYFTAGADGTPYNYGAIRFTVPPRQGGNYRLETSVRDLFDGFHQGDTDFHVVRNGVEVFGRSVPVHTTAGYSNILALAEGDTIDLLIGRGQDGHQAGSGLKLLAKLTLATNSPPPPPPPRGSFDVSRDFSATDNPHGVWSFGYQTSLGGAFTLLGFPLTSFGDNPVPVNSWSKNGYEPVAIYHNGTTNTSISDGGAGVFPPGTSWFYPGIEGHEDNYGVIRFTVPLGGAGTYQLKTEVQAYLDGPRSGDTDFHVMRGGVELFGEFISGNSGTSYSNRLSLVEGDTIDFAVGRGRDDVAFDSGLKIRASFALVVAPPPPPPPTPSFELSRDYSLAANPNGPWSYGYLTALDGSFGLLGAARTFGADNGVPIGVWELNTYQLPIVAKVLGPGTARSDGDHFTAEPGTIYFAPGADGAPQNFGVIRFTVPAGAGGQYRLATSVRSLFDNARSRDADFHVLKNGEELFGEFLPPNAGASYSNVLALAPGDHLDFAIGRGADGLTADTGLKIQAVLTLVANAPPPPPANSFDLSRDYSLAANPNGPWSYGYLTASNGSFGLLGATRTFSADNGVPIAAWELNTYQIPGVWKVLGPGVAHSDGDHFTAEPGTVYFAPGADGAPQNFGVIRFIVPADAGGHYRLATSVSSLFDGSRSRDADFHVLKNGEELFGEFLPPNSGTSYSNVLALAPGDHLDFVIGRGADGLTADTGLKVNATLVRVTLPPPPTNCSAAPLRAVAWWPAEGNPNDVVGTNSGALFGGASFSTGKVNRAFTFPGGDSGVKISASPSLDVGSGGGLTVEGWINPADLSIRGPLVEWNRGGPGIIEWGVHLYILRPDEFGLGAGNLVANLAESSGQPHFLMAPGGTVQANTWQHIALTYDKASGEARLYRNGEVVASENLGTFEPETGYDLYLGRRPAGDAILSYHGLLDEIAIYDRALSAGEVAAIAGAGGSGKCRIPAALDELVDLVLDVTVPSETQPLLANLEAVRASITRGNLIAAIHQLQAFQNQVRAQVGLLDEALAEELADLAQQIIEALDPTGTRRVMFVAAAVTPLRLDRCVLTPGGATCVEGSGAAGVTCCVQRSTNLVDWEQIGCATEFDDGKFEFIDANPPAGATRFYRLYEP